MDTKNRLDSLDNYANIKRDMKLERLDGKSKALYAKHIEVATLTLKILNTLKVDKFVRDVMTARILSPIATGKERTHLSIALEYGVSVDEVKSAERYGVSIIEEMLKKVDNQEFIDKFNRDEKLHKAIENEIGKSKEKPLKESYGGKND